MLQELPVAVSSPTRWLVVNAQPHRETVAIEHLGRQDFLAYCPLIRKRITHARRTMETMRPLFPGYLFVAFDVASQRWQPLLSTRGIRSVVRCGDAPSFIGADFIRKLREREIDGVIGRPAIPFKVGQDVRVVDGALDGLIGTIIELGERERLVVLLNLLNRPVRVTLNASKVCELASSRT